MNFYGEDYLKAIPADIIRENERGTFLGWFDRSKFNKELAVESQPIWRIRLFEQQTDGNSVVTRTLYPNGDRNFNFKFSDIDTLTYDYAK